MHCGFQGCSYLFYYFYILLNYEFDDPSFTNILSIDTQMSQAIHFSSFNFFIAAAKIGENILSYPEF